MQSWGKQRLRIGTRMTMAYGAVMLTKKGDLRFSSY